MGVRPLNSLVAITECASRFEADAAVARLAAAGIDAMVLGDPASSVAPHLVTERGFSVLVRIAIADDAQQVLVRGTHPSHPPDSSPMLHPALRPRTDDRTPGGSGRVTGPPPPQPDRADPSDATDDDERDPAPGPRDLRRPHWVRAVAWAMVASVLLPLLLSALRAVAQL